MNDRPYKLGPEPEAKLLAWCPTWAGEPRTRQPWVAISIWVPHEIGASYDIGMIADYIHANTGFDVARTSGWSGGSRRPGGLSLVSVTVKSALVRARLKAA